MGSESAFTKNARLNGEHQTTTSSTSGPNLESTENKKGRQRQHKDPEDDVETQVVEEGLKSLPEITHERVREHNMWGMPEQASSVDSDYTGTQAGPVPVTLETKNVHHREHKDPVDKLHSQVVDEGGKPLLEIKHERVREHYVGGLPEQSASDESDYTETGPVPTNMGSTLEVIDSIDEDLFQVVLRQRKHTEGSHSAWLDSSSSTGGKLLELGNAQLDTDYDAVTSNLINRHREHTTTLAATASSSPGLQMGLDSIDSDAVVGLDSLLDSLSSEDFELIPELSKTEATASAQLFSTLHTQHIALAETAPSRLRMREHDTKTTTVGAGEDGEMYSSDYIQNLSAIGTSAEQGVQNSEAKSTLRNRAHEEPTGTLESHEQTFNELSNEEQFPSRSPNSSHQDEPANGLTRRRKHNERKHDDANVPFVSNASPTTSPTRTAMKLPEMSAQKLL